VGLSALRLLSEFLFKTATNEERAGALALYRRVYLADVGFVPSDLPDEEGTYLVAHHQPQGLVATLRFLGPEHRPFDFEKRCDLAPLLSPESSAALIGRFCVDPDFRAAPRSMILHLGMLKLALAHARGKGVSDLVLYTQPHLIRFYRSAYFHPTGVSFDYPNLPHRMHVMVLRIADLAGRSRQRSSARTEILLSEDLPNFIL